MASEDFPLLLFPQGATIEKREDGGRGGGRDLTFPNSARQGVRLNPKFQRLEEAMDAKRLQLYAEAPGQDPEFVLVLEIAGTQDDFYKAVERIPQADWLFETGADFEPDADFHFEEDGLPLSKSVNGRVFMVGTDQSALRQILSFWSLYQENAAVPFPRGFAPLKHVFTHLIDVRRWDVRDRLDHEMHEYWLAEVDSGNASTRFELEAWYFSSATKNAATDAEIRRFVLMAGGRVIASSLIDEISYHGFLVELSIAMVREILDGRYPDFVLSDRVMFFRPRAQSISDSTLEPSSSEGVAGTTELSTEGPVVALLDGLPMANHALLRGRLLIDDPDLWESGYEAKDRVHGTAMASLILHGDLSANHPPSQRKLYVRPIMRPNPTAFSHRRPEETPDSVLLIDLVHRAVRRIVEGDDGGAAAAPSVRVVNISVGNAHRIFHREVSPWARLIDWLSAKYSLLFIISSGNDPSDLALAIQRDTLPVLSDEERHASALKALLASGASRRLMSPGESMNALTVGASHADSSTPQSIPTRFDLFPSDGVSPISRIGLGIRRSIKPDILMPGGRLLYRQHLQTPPTSTIAEAVILPMSPGQLAARPPAAGGASDEAEFSRGTSNATALASRFAVRAFDVLETMRKNGSDVPREYDAVLLKAMVVHGASWGDIGKQVAQHGPAVSHAHASARATQQKDFISAWIGYGPIDEERALTCASNRATLIGFGTVIKDQALAFTAPVPPGLGGKVVWRRMTVTLAWLTPVRSSTYKYRQAKLWINPPDNFATARHNTPDHNTVRRGTIQHEVWEGSGQAVPLVEGGLFKCQVNCMEDAPGLAEGVRFAICVSLEVPIEAGIDVYGEIRDRLRPQIRPEVS
jgi:hypothetical protein